MYGQLQVIEDPLDCGALCLKGSHPVLRIDSQSSRTLAICLFLMIVGSVAVLGDAVTTHHNDIKRAGATLNEAILNTSNVNVNSFGKLFSRIVDGQIYAQPLYAPTLTIPGQGVHNVIYVGTEHNTVYAFDADFPGMPNPLWHVILGPSVPATVLGGVRDLLPEIGITGTPVLDLQSGTLYVVAETYENGNVI